MAAQQWLTKFAALAATLTVMLGCSAPSSETATTTQLPDMVMPDLVGMYWVEAYPLLQSLGWFGMISREPDKKGSAAESNRITRQKPPPGEHVERDVLITLQFSS